MNQAQQIGAEVAASEVGHTGAPFSRVHGHARSPPLAPTSPQQTCLLPKFVL